MQEACSFRMASNTYAVDMIFASYEGGVVSVFLERIKLGATLSVHGDGEQTRDFIFVSDIVKANLAALDRGNQETIQIGTSQRTSINEVLSHLSGIHGFNVETASTARRDGDIKHSCLCNKKALQLLGWSPEIDIKKGLKETYFYGQDRLNSDWGMQ